jgi:hypothetical protein
MTIAVRGARKRLRPGSEDDVDGVALRIQCSVPEIDCLNSADESPDWHPFDKLGAAPSAGSGTAA